MLCTAFLRAAVCCSPQTVTICRAAGRTTPVIASRLSTAPPKRILIIGGGIMGSSTAYWLKLREGNKVNVTVLEKDPSYAQSSTALSVGGLRQQFSLEENIQMSLYGAEFLRNVNKYLKVEGFPSPEVKLTQNGYLLLASEKGAAYLQENSCIQNELGACNELLTPEQLVKKFPWLNTEGIVLGCHGLKNEGWFDPWLLLEAFKQKAIDLGANYVTGEVVDLSTSETGTDPVTGAHVRVDSALVKTDAFDTTRVLFDRVLITAGSQSGRVSELAGIGKGQGDLSVPLPVEPRKRCVYYFRCVEGPDADTPLTVDPSGTYFRREGEKGNYICGRSPPEHEEPCCDNLDVVDDYFEEKVWPVLAMRVPAFENLKVKSSWAGFYEYNTIDQNGVIGRHPSFHNLYFATGFSGHGIQHGPAVGRAMMELLLDDCYHTINLSRFGFERLLKKEPLCERNII